MARMKPLPSVPVFCQLFKTMLTMKHYSAVVSLFQEMWKLRIPINDFMLSILINSYCLIHHVDCAFSLLPIYLKTGIPFNVVAFNTLLRGLFAENKVKDAVELFKKVARENICELDQVMETLPNVFNYNIVVDALCKDENLVAAITLKNEMKQKGIHPDTVTYGSLIDGLCKLGQWEKVRTLFSEMVNLNIYPDMHTFNILIDGLCKKGKVEDADEVMRHMIEKGVEPDIITYNVIMDGYCLDGQVDRARRVFYVMIDDNAQSTALVGV
ncbi:hypothetical protein CQW23_13957 [Capsicum baccatum]|uniref:Pentatricopeptide repeat-containing protein, mitochondrial n=1 Tax=Capsicum baccatum TaxID=33114 RepID=A0A2G2WI08_CAPBA|nr:hypothetical protein CQW23_13957 [Capsicum baccatum]